MSKFALAVAVTCILRVLAYGHPARIQAALRVSHPPDSNEIKKVFHQLVKNKLHASQVVITSDVIDSLDDLMDKGAATLSQHNASPEQVDQAKETLSNFIDNMIGGGDRLRGSGIRISVKTYKKTKKSICPLFPFC